MAFGASTCPGSCQEALDDLIQQGAARYERRRHLPRLIPIEEERLVDPSQDEIEWIVTRLAKALRAERRKGIAGHWTYDLNRHIALMQAYRAELAPLVRPTGKVPEAAQRPALAAGGRTAFRAARLRRAASKATTRRRR